MLRRPLLPLLLVLVLVGGVAPALAVAGAAPPAVAAEPCPTVPVSTPDEAPADAEPGGGPARGGCWTVTPQRDGAHVVQLSYDEPFLRTRVRVLDPDGGVVVDQPWENGDPAPTPRLRAGVAYRVEVAPSNDSAVTPELRIAVFDLAEGCRPLPEPRWSAPLERFDLSDDRLACGTVTTTTETPLRIQLGPERPWPTLAVLDETGRQVCTDARRSPGRAVRCESLPAGRYRVVTGVRGGTGDEVGLAAIPVDTMRDCVATAPGRYGAPLPVAARRAADGEGQECYAMAAPTTGPFDLRTWQHADRLDWAVDHELWDATAGRLVTAYAGDAHVNPGPRPERVDLVAGHSYRLLVSGRPFVDLAGGERRAFDPRYELGLIDRTGTEGCVPLRTGWDVPALAGRVETGEVTCHLLDAAPGTWARVDLRPTGSTAGTDLGQRVLDADGRQVQNREVGVTCQGRGDLENGRDPWSCPLDGPGPYRVLTHAAWGAGEADHTLGVTLPTEGAGCAPLPTATWGEPLPGAGTRAAGGAGAECWTTEVAADGRQLLTLAESGGSWRHGRVEVFAADDGRPVGGNAFPFSNLGSTADLARGTYRVVVSGDPGTATGGYRLGLHDLTGTASDGGSSDGTCPALTSTSLAAEPDSGTTAGGSRDCFRLGDVDGPVLTRLTSTADRTEALATVYDRRGWAVCGAQPGEERRCDLEGTGPYRVVVGDSTGDAGSAYRVSVREPSRRQGCRPASAAATGAAPETFGLAAGGASACVALPDTTDELLWALDAPDGVRAVLLDGAARPVCANDAGEADSQVCGLGDRPAPYSLVLTNTGVVDVTARTLLRHDPAAEPGCVRSTVTRAGPRPLTGATTAPLDLRCHVVRMRRGEGHALNRSHGAGGVPPDVHGFEPGGGYGCGGTGVGAIRDYPVCGASRTGDRVFLVVGSADSVGPYRVDLRCSRSDCVRSPRIELRPGAMRGPIRVGRTLSAAGVTGVPPGGTVAWRWRVDGTVVRRTRTYTPTRADRGRRLQLVAVVTAPDHPRTVRRTAAREVLPARRR